MERSDAYVTDMVVLLEGLTDPEIFLRVLLQTLTAKDERHQDGTPHRDHIRLLFHDTILGRLEAIRLDDNALFQSQVMPVLRRLPNLHLPELLAAMRRRRAPPGPQDAPPRQFKVIHLAEVDEEPIDWLWWPYLAKGTLNIVDGDPGIGKSLFTLYLGALLSRGYPLPDQLGQPTLPTGGPQTTLLFTLEDSVSRTIKPRLLQAGADVRRIHVVQTVVQGDDERMIQLKTDMDLLEAEVLTTQPALVIFDPLHAYLGDLDIHRANETRPLLARLIQLAEATQTTFLGIRHPAKPGQQVGKAIHRGLGSIDIGASMRCGLYIEQHPVKQDQLLLCHYKSNIGPYGRTQVFSKAEGRFTWAGVTRLSADAIAGQGRGPHPQAFLEACFWLEALFTPTQPQYRSTEIRDRADEAEIAWSTLRAAKKALGVSAQKVGKDSWLWSLHPMAPIPPPFPRDTPASSASTSTTDSIATLASSATSTTIDSSTKSIGYGMQSEGAEVVEEVEGAEEAKEAAVESEAILPPGRMRWARPAQDPRPRRDTDA